MRDTLGDTLGGFTLFLLCRHLENTLCQLGSCPPPRGCDIIKGEKCSAPAQLDEILSVPPLLLPALPALAECLQCVPDESPRASWAEGREGVPWSARSGRHGGRKGTSNSSAWQAIWNRHCKHVYLTMVVCITWHLLNFLAGLLIKHCEYMCVYNHIHCVLLS